MKSVWKPTPPVATTDAIIATEDNEVALTEGEIRNIFQDTCSEDEFGNE